MGQKIKGPDRITGLVSGDAVSGNPISYYNNGNRWTFSWEDGRKLVSANSVGNTISYGYDLNGVRDSKTVNGVEHKYYYADDQLLRETYGNNILDFIYDSNGNPYALIYNGTTYYYVTNLQGDVMYMVDANGATVATYEYDPYGKGTSATGAMAEINPLRYRGYYYDSETGFYYLQSRYYDPEICRFINADGYTSTGQGFVGYNMFAYCLNDPVSRLDSAGSASFENQITDNEDGSHTVITTIYCSCGVHKVEYSISAQGIVKFSFEKNAGASAAWTYELHTLVDAIFKAAKEVDESYLRGRTHMGVANEISYHYDMYTLGVDVERAEPVDIGSRGNRRTDYDWNAWMFECTTLAVAVVRIPERFHPRKTSSHVLPNGSVGDTVAVLK